MPAKPVPSEVRDAATVLLTYLVGIVREVAEQSAASDSEGYYDAKTSPMGQTGFLRLAREGAFPTFRMGRKLVAKRQDVHAFIESQERRKADTTKPQPRKAPRSDSAAAICDWMIGQDTEPSTERSR
jgi:hypothetical protein